MAPRLEEIAATNNGELTSGDPKRVERALGGVESALGDYDASTTMAANLRDEFAAMVCLYRAVREADAFMQSVLRSSDVGEQLLRVYYALRTTQAALSMRYAVEGRGVEPPETSPLGTAIGLFDAPKVLAQHTHLMSGSYDGDLPRFVSWMKEIWTDMTVRRADYLRFYGEPDVNAATASLRDMLGFDADGETSPRDFSPGSVYDPAALLDRLRRWAGEGNDLVDAARAIQEAGREARLSLLALLANHDDVEAELGIERVGEIESGLRTAIGWRFPVGETVVFDLAAEQDAFDELLSRVPIGVLPASEHWVETTATVLRRACQVEQSLRDHTAEYRARYSDARDRRSFRWYVWEFLNLLDRARQQRYLGVRR
jgi:hypothetical protein